MRSPVRNAKGDSRRRRLYLDPNRVVSEVVDVYTPAGSVARRGTADRCSMQTCGVPSPHRSCTGSPMNSEPPLVPPPQSRPDRPPESHLFPPPLGTFTPEAA